VALCGDSVEEFLHGSVSYERFRTLSPATCKTSLNLWCFLGSDVVYYDVALESTAPTFRVLYLRAQTVLWSVHVAAQRRDIAHHPNRGHEL
jgi:hypothetical protein